MDSKNTARAVDPFGVQDIFVSGLAEVESVGGGCLRFSFFSTHHVGCGEERIVVAKLVMPVEALTAAMLKSAKAAGIPIAVEIERLN